MGKQSLQGTGAAGQSPAPGVPARGVPARLLCRPAQAGLAALSSLLPLQAHYCLGDEYHTESSRGSDLSDILEEDEEELYSEMQLEEGGRRRLSLTSHGALKVRARAPLGAPRASFSPSRAAGVQLSVPGSCSWAALMHLVPAWLPLTGKL